MILAGGRGTRFKEYTEDIPKPMIEALGRPFLLHIIDLYAKYNIENVLILADIKKEVITNYFSDKFKSSKENVFIYKNIRIQILDTGLDTMTGGRVLKV